MVQQGYIHRNQRLISVIQRSLDVVIISGCLWINHVFYQGASVAPSLYIITALLGSSFFYMIGSSNGLYQSWRFEALSTQLKVITQTWLITAISLLILGWAIKASSDLSRVVVGFWLISTPFVLLLSRIVVRQVLNHLRNMGRNTRNIAIVGHGELAELFRQEVKSNPWMGYHIKGFYAEQNPAEQHQDDYLGDYSYLLQDAKNGILDEIFIALPMSEEENIRQLIIDLSDGATPIHIVPDLFFSKLMHARMSSIGNMATISVFNSPHDDFSSLLKRLEDILLSIPILILIGPLMVAIALMIKLSSRGPVLFKQKRYGIGSDAISVWKFRSMHVCENDSQNIQQAQKNDSRITPLGGFLRKTSLDELPQFINVLQGSMSIVGPRPHAVAHNELYRKDIEGYMLRHLVKPGITGWAQVNGWRGETDTLDKMEKRIEFDLFYIRHWSILFDLKIIALTVFKGFFNKNAY